MLGFCRLQEPSHTSKEKSKDGYLKNELVKNDSSKISESICNMIRYPSLGKTNEVIQ